MFIPFVPNTTIINKTIVYSDTVLNLKDLGSNIKVTSISGVSESSLEKCLKTIFEHNKDVVFNTIQYSKENKKVYFYTDKEISIKEYEDSKFTKYKPITSTLEILEEVKIVLLLEKNKDKSCISLYDLSLLLKKYNTEYENIKEKYREQFKKVLREKISDNSSIIIYDFDYKNKILDVWFTYNWDVSDYKSIYFAKKNGDLYVVKSESLYTEEVFRYLSSGLSNLYDELLEYTDYKDDSKSKYCKKAINSKFGINISHFGVEIYVTSTDNRFSNQFELESLSYEEGYGYKCNSSKVNEAINGNEDEIFKKIFVKISDCPIWCQEELYEIRNNQLEEEKRIEDELKYQEMKKQKKRELIRKVFPFLKR